MEINATLVIQIMILFITLLWLSPMLITPMLAVFKERDRRINDAKNEGMHLKEMALKKAQEFDLAYDKAQKKAREFLSHIKQASDNEHRDRLADVKAEVLKKLNDAEILLHEQVNQVRNDLDKKAHILAKDIVNHLLLRDQI